MDDNDLPANFDQGQVCEDVSHADTGHDRRDDDRLSHPVRVQMQPAATKLRAVIEAP